MSTRARHVDATNPERVRVMMATGRRPAGGDMEVATDRYSEIRRMIRRWGREKKRSGEIDAMLGRGTTAEDARVQDDRTDRAFRRLAFAIRWETDRQQNGRRAGDRPATPAVSPPEEADSRKVAGRSDPSKPYVVTVGSPGGVVDERYYSGFAAMVAGARELTERYCHPSRVVVCGNWDRADVDSDGLSDAERALLEELL